MKAKVIKKAAEKFGKKVAAESGKAMRSAVKAAKPKIKQLKRAAKPIVKKVARAAEDFADDAMDKGREIVKDTLSASAKKLKKASKAL